MVYLQGRGHKLLDKMHGYPHILHVIGSGKPVDLYHAKLKQKILHV